MNETAVDFNSKNPTDDFSSSDCDGIANILYKKSTESENFYFRKIQISYNSRDGTVIEFHYNYANESDFKASLTIGFCLDGQDCVTKNILISIGINIYSNIITLYM